MMLVIVDIVETMVGGEEPSACIVHLVTSVPMPIGRFFWDSSFDHFFSPTMSASSVVPASHTTAGLCHEVVKDYTYHPSLDSAPFRYAYTIQYSLYTFS